MRINKIIWVIVAIVVVATVAISFGRYDGHSQTQKTQPTPTPERPFGNLSKYPAVDYDEPEPTNAVELEERKIKSKRYKVSVRVLRNPYPDDIAIGGSDVESEPEPSNAIPFSESALVLIGWVKESNAFLANEKKASTQSSK
ncbi:MAG: hypothetical protein ACKVQW_02740 [Pyrinomonadaceae bacterium]